MDSSTKPRMQFSEGLSNFFCYQSSFLFRAVTYRKERIFYHLIVTVNIRVACEISGSARNVEQYTRYGLQVMIEREGNNEHKFASIGATNAPTPSAMHLAGLEDRGPIELLASDRPQIPLTTDNLRELLTMSNPDRGNGGSANRFQQMLQQQQIQQQIQQQGTINNDPQGMLLNLLKRRAEDATSLDAQHKRQRTADESKEMSVPNQALMQSSGMQGGPTPFFLGQGDHQHNSLASNLLMNDQFMRAELRARHLQQEMTANRNAALIASLLGQSQVAQNMNYPPLTQQQHQQLLDTSTRGQASNSFGGAEMDILNGIVQRNRHCHGLPSNHLNHQLQRSNMFSHPNVDVSAIIRQINWPGQGLDASQNFESAARASSRLPTSQGNQGFGGSTRLPPCEEGLIPPFPDREKFPLGVEEDANWLSEFHCFVRSELVEICRASHDDCKTRNNATSYQQVGIRCRFCAHRPPTGRGCRSSAYPSSIRQIYQSFTMMLRDHFGTCDAIPDDVKERFLILKDKPSQGATDSKRYWIYSAMKAGLADSSEGIIMNQHTVLTGMSAPPFGGESSSEWQKEASIACPLVTSADASLGSSYLRFLLSQAQVVQLRESERIGNRRSLEHGLPGFSCRYCWEKRRSGLCRMFPARRRTLSQKLNDLQDHLRRCQATPVDVKEKLESFRSQNKVEAILDTGDTKALLDRVWARLGHRIS